ncbi:MAG: carboxypeptidase-like regulatory domain-containing protein, partial [Planctomycetota bacterium]|nr:carboxypeptidase-like regulatory domain-containing protein [Planctomycetota bacterium]
NLFSHHYARDIQVSPEQPVELRIEITTGSVFGEVRDRNGAAVDDCRIVLFDRGGDGRSSSLRVTRSDARGGFSFAQIPSGTYELRAEKENQGKATLAGVAVVGSGTIGPIAVVLTPLAKVTGRVVFDTPAPNRADVHFVPLDGGEDRHTGTQPDGRFELGSMPIGRYRVEVRSPANGKPRGAGEVFVVAPLTADLVLRLGG